MIQVNNLDKCYGRQVIFDKAGFTLNSLRDNEDGIDETYKAETILMGLGFTVDDFNGSSGWNSSNGWNGYL